MEQNKGGLRATSLERKYEQLAADVALWSKYN